MPITPSPLRYPGGKTKLYEYVKSIIEANDLIGETYIEPFAGGAGLALKLLINEDVKKIIINDFDPAIYSVWHYILTNPDEMCQFIQEIPVSIEEWDNQHKIYVNQRNYSQMELAKAALFLNRTNVSGVITGGIIGGRKQDKINKIDARFNREELIKKIRIIASLADRIDVYNMDATEFLKKVLKHYYKVFINFDPPYVEKGGKLYRNFFTKEDHENLKKQIKCCTRKWIVTYDMCDYIAELYSEFRFSTVDLNYSANRTRKAKEYVFFSPNLVIPDRIDVFN